MTKMMKEVTVSVCVIMISVATALTSFAGTNVQGDTKVATGSNAFRFDFSILETEPETEYIPETTPEETQPVPETEPETTEPEETTPVETETPEETLPEETTTPELETVPETTPEPTRETEPERFWEPTPETAPEIIEETISEINDYRETEVVSETIPEAHDFRLPQTGEFPVLPLVIIAAIVMIGGSLIIANRKRR